MRAEPPRPIRCWPGPAGRGADAVLVCAADPSSATMLRVPELCRDRASVVVVGDVGLDLHRTPFYERELSVRFARSYGPGRYDPSYEAWGVDYPAGQVRWTEGRNFEAVLDMLAAGRLKVSDLVTHTFGIGEATEAYRLIETRSDPYLAIRLSYPATAAADAPVMVRVPHRGQLVAGRRLDRRGRLLDRDAAACVPGRWLRSFRRGHLGQRSVRAPRRPAARLREGRVWGQRGH